MPSSIIQWLVSALVVGLAAFLVPGVEVSVVGALLGALVIGLINTFIKPVISALTLPINILTLGIFSLIVNTLLILLAAYIVPGFSVAGFWPALLFVIVLTLITIFFGVGRKNTTTL